MADHSNRDVEESMPVLFEKIAQRGAISLRDPADQMRRRGPVDHDAYYDRAGVRRQWRARAKARNSRYPH